MRSLIIALFFFSVNISTGFVCAQTPDLVSTQTELLYYTFEQQHYSPRKLDDSLSANIFDKLIANLDPHHLYFTEAEMNELLAYRLKLDLALTGKDTTFFPMLCDKYKQALLRSQKIITTVLSTPFDYQIQETYKSSDFEANFAPTSKMLELRWKKWLKYKTLWRMADMSAIQEYTNASLANFLSMEPAARAKVKIIEERKIKRILEHPDGYRSHLANDFLNVITNCYDPHSMFMSRTDLENFQAHLSTDGFSFGIEMKENDNGDIEIARITPGGPAWKSNEINKGDLVLSLQWEGKNLIDLTGAYAYEAQEIMNASNSGRLEFTIRKTDGQEKKIFLSKEKLVSDENIVKSVILHGSNAKIGYISLPGFYTEWEDDAGLGCSNDVAREIIKLKEEGIEGLIIDVRYNGGGSLHEGMNLAGIFINEGPLFIMTHRGEKPQVVKDANRGTVYDGPLIVMINGQSASASELFAGTLQDYNRAIIVGSSTYGKATGQRIMSIDSTVANRAVNYSEPDSPFGYTSVTILKLYRVSGKSAQLSGVTPDIALPDIYDCIDYKESTLDYALPSDTVNKKVYYTPLAAYPVTALKDKSQSRVKQNKGFNIISNFVDSIGVLNEEGELGVALQYKQFVWRAYRYNLIEKQLSEYDSDSLTSYQAVNNKYEKEVIRIDSYSHELNTIYLNQISHDIYIEEAYLILSDLIMLNKK